MNDKAALRAEMSARRASLQAAQPTAGLALSARLPRLAGSPGVVAGYWPFRSEIDPRPMMARFALAGWRVALPVTPAKGLQQPLSFRLWTPGAEMASHAFGMSEPPATADTVRPDVVLVPLLAFDAFGHRLGYGAGHYDRTLAALRAAGPVRAIGVAFAGQAVAQLPIGPHDQPLDAILTELAFTPFRHRPT